MRDEYHEYLGWVIELKDVGGWWWRALEVEDVAGGRARRPRDTHHSSRSYDKSGHALLGAKASIRGIIARRTHRKRENHVD